MNWVSVESSLPEKDNCYVLVSCEGGLVTTSFYTKNRELLKCYGRSYSRKVQGELSGYFELAHRYGYKINHWMYLPEAPL